MPEAHLNGIDLAWERQGTGPALLLIGGLASDATSWAPLRAGLARDFDLILPDNRCSGRTRPNPCPVSRAQLCDDLLHLLDQLGVQKVAVAGHSLGGMIARDLALAAPDRVRALVSLSAPAIVDGRSLSLFRDLAEVGLVPGVDRPLWFRLLFPSLFGRGFLADRARMVAASQTAAIYPYAQSPEGFAAQVAALAEYVTPPDLARITCPVLAMTGSEDLICPAPLHAESLAALPRLTVEVIEGAAHSLHWEAPEAVLAAMRAFLTV